MKSRSLFLAVFGFLVAACSKNDLPLSLHPDNPHYFLFRGKPALLIGSTEHYGAVLNLDFDYRVYLDALAASDLNVTRTFTGVYMEPQGAFGIEKNTLAPAAGKLICPWARSNQPGYAMGGNKFDLDQWDEAYFNRLKDFIAEAGKRNIVVELDLFSNFYDTLQWKLSPLYIENNINSAGNFLNHKEVLSLQHPEILAMQENMVRKIVETLKDFDNLYYEVCNEPYFGELDTLEKWEQHMTGVIAEAEKDFEHKHLISQNIFNGSQKIDKPNPLVSIFNFHYAAPPTTVGLNYTLNKVIGDNETGFNGTSDAVYRKEAWNFMVAGGGLFNNLDYSFTVDEENGSFKFGEKQPGGGGATLRSQLKILKNTMDALDFIQMEPSDYVIVNNLNKKNCRVLAREGKQYLVYLNQEGTGLSADTISLEIPKGNYNGQWIDTKTGHKTEFKLERHPGGVVKIITPIYSEDIALKILKP